MNAPLVKPYQYLECGLDDVYLLNGYEFVTTPRGRSIHIEDMEGLHRAIGDYLLHEKKNLNGREFRFLRHEVNLTQQSLAALLSTDVQAVGRWERGECDRIPGAAQSLMRFLYEEHVGGDPEIREALEHLAALDEMDQDKGLMMEETPSGWRPADQAA